jgi:hypothetical protein
MIIHSTTCSDISYLLRKLHFFHQKSYMMLSFNVRQNGPEINLPVSHAQRTFGPGRRQRIYACTWRGYNRLLYRNQVSTPEAIHLYSCWPPEESATIIIDQATVDTLEHYPFSSIWELVHLTCIPTTTIHQQLTQSLGFVAKHLRWVPEASHLLKDGACHSIN